MPGGFIETALRNLCANVQLFPLSVIDARNNNARAGRRNAMCNKLSAGANATAAGNFQDAIDQLVSLGQKLDGNPQPKDWMVESAERDSLVTGIGNMIVLLQFLLP